MLGSRRAEGGSCGPRHPANQPPALRGLHSEVRAGDHPGLRPRRQRVHSPLSPVPDTENLPGRNQLPPSRPRSSAELRAAAGAARPPTRPSPLRPRGPAARGPAGFGDAPRCSGHALSPAGTELQRTRPHRREGGPAGRGSTDPKGTVTQGRSPSQGRRGGRSKKEGGDQKESQGRHKHQHCSCYGQR